MVADPVAAQRRGVTLSARGRECEHDEHDECCHHPLPGAPSLWVANPPRARQSGMPATITTAPTRGPSARTPLRQAISRAHGRATAATAIVTTRKRRMSLT